MIVSNDELINDDQVIVIGESWCIWCVVLGVRTFSACERGRFAMDACFSLTALASASARASALVLFEFMRWHMTIAKLAAASMCSKRRAGWLRLHNVRRFERCQSPNGQRRDRRPAARC